MKVKKYITPYLINDLAENRSKIKFNKPLIYTDTEVDDEGNIERLLATGNFIQDGTGIYFKPGIWFTVDVGSVGPTIADEDFFVDRCEEIEADFDIQE